MTGMSDRMDEAFAVLGRLVLFALVALLVLFLSGVALKPFLPNGLPTGRDGRVLFAMMVAFGLVVAHIVTVAVSDRGHWWLAGFGEGQWSVRWLLAGPISGVVGVLLGVVVLVLVGALAAVPSPASDAGTFLLDALLLIGVLAAVEELAFRGYLFGVLEVRLGHRTTILLTSLAFALFHSRGALTTGVTLLAAFVAGIFLGVIRWRGGLPAAWLGQLGIVGTQVILLHFPSRGIELGSPPGWRLVSSGADWLSGGSWGVEGGVAVAAGLTVVTFLLFRVPRSFRPTSRYE